MSRFKRFDAFTQTARQLVELDALTLDGGTQPREAMDSAIIQEYAERMLQDDRGLIVDPEGTDWQKLVVFEDDTQTLWLADGFHRTFAARKAGLERFQADFREGTKREAIAYSLGVNANHGKRRTNADKRRTVARALADEEWSCWTDSRLARMCKVSRPFVSSVRAQLEQAGAIVVQDELVREDGQPQHRDTPRPASPQPTQKPATSCQRAKPTRLHFTSLAGLSAPASTHYIAYPVTASDWQLLCEHAPTLLASCGILLCCLPQDDALLFEGPAMLARALPRRVPRIIFHLEHERFFASFGHPSAPARATSAQLLSGQGGVTLIGQPLEVWLY